MLNRFLYAALGFAACALFTLGCNNSGTTPAASPSASPPAAEGQDHSGHDHGGEAGHDHSGHDHGEHAHGGDSDNAKAMASLSAEDRAAAEKQKTCPVSDEPLGSMGAPIKVTVEGRDVFVCCDGCTDRLKTNPAKFLAKLPQQ